MAIAVIVALMSSIRRDGPAALQAWRESDVRLEWIVVAFFCGLVGHGLNVVGWKRLIEDCGVRIGWISTVRMFAVSSLGRYLPAGKAWQLGIVGAMAVEEGMPIGTLTASSLFHGAVGVLVGGLILLAAGGAALGVTSGLVILPVLGVASLLALPFVMRRVPVVNEVLARRVPQISAVTSGTMWVLVWSAAASWVAWGLGLYALGFALLDGVPFSPVESVFAWVGSFLGGLIMFVAPAGLGAREGIMQGVLTHSGLSPGSALLLTAVARVGATILDVVPAMAILAVRRSPEGIAGPASENSAT